MISSNLDFLESKNYIKVTASISDGKDTISTTAVAREANDKKKMDSAQLSGATSSYARKYALNGLFLIDDTRDADATNDHGKKEAPKKPVAKDKPEAKKSTSSFRRKKKDDYDDI